MPEPQRKRGRPRKEAGTPFNTRALIDLGTEEAEDQGLYPENLFCQYLTPEEDAKWVARFKAEPREFHERYLKIRLKDSDRVAPFSYNVGQQRIYRIIQRLRAEGRPVRLVILKARQLGSSTLTEAFAFWRARFWKHTNALIISHNKTSAEAIFEMSKLFYEELPEAVRPMRSRYGRGLMRFENPDADLRLKYPGMRSQIQVATARTVDVGRGQTLQFVHASEFAFWPDPYGTFTSVMQCVPNEPDTFVVIESTAKGADDAFYKLWQLACSDSPDNVWTPVFLPFWIEPSYEKDLPMSVPEYEKTLDEYERDLLREYPGFMNLRKIQWRRYKIATDCNNSITDFNREGAPTAEEAFVARGETIFDVEAVRWYMVNTRREGRRGHLKMGPRNRPYFVADDDGPLTVWEPPQAGEDYVAGIDASQGLGDDESGKGVVSLKDEPDYSAAVVLSAHRIQVAEFHSNSIEPDDYGSYLYMLGIWYNWALLFPEVGNQYGGMGVVRRLKELHYPRFGMWEKFDHKTKKYTAFIGFEPTTRSMGVLLPKIRKEVRRGAGRVPPDLLLPDERRLPPLVIRSRKLLNEMTTYTVQGSGAGAKSGSHDDLVAALGIAVLGLEQIPVPRDLDRKAAEPAMWYTGEDEQELPPVPGSGPPDVEPWMLL